MSTFPPTQPTVAAQDIRPSGLDPARIEQLMQILSQIDLMGAGPLPIPWTSPPTLEALSQAIDQVAPTLPLIYQRAYVAPLQSNLSHVLAAVLRPGNQTNEPAETLLGVVYGLAPGSEIAAPLQRFSAVVSDLYDSFLNKAKRSRLRVPLSDVISPLATFRSSGDLGPFTYPVDRVAQLIGGQVGVVSLPSTYREHPLLWGSLAHEVGGHDVVHADEGLLQELQRGVAALMGALAPSCGPQIAGLLGSLWAYWMDEAVADVYAVMNMGPAFTLNFTCWLAAFRNRCGQTSLPLVATDALSGYGPLDTHPVDLLRIHLTLGAIGTLGGLNPASRVGYSGIGQYLAGMACGGAQQVTVQGLIAQPDGTATFVNQTLPLPLMQYAAALVGAFIATARTQALAGNSIQAIETWDDTDELMAQRNLAWFEGLLPGGPFGDVAQTLAGATLAALRAPESYQAITQQLNTALDCLFRRDPIWGAPLPDFVALPPAAIDDLFGLRPLAQTG